MTAFSIVDQLQFRSVILLYIEVLDSNGSFPGYCISLASVDPPARYGDGIPSTTLPPARVTPGSGGETADQCNNRTTVEIWGSFVFVLEAAAAFLRQLGSKSLVGGCLKCSTL